MRGPGWETVVDGIFAEADLIVEAVADRLTPSGETEALIEAAWNLRMAEAERAGRLLYPGPLCRLSGWERDGSSLRLRLGQTDYRELVGTNLTHPELAARHGEAALANGLGLCAAVTTSDGFLLIQQRSATVDHHPGWFHVPGGNLERTPTGEAPHPFAAIRAELREELLVDDAEITGVVCLGLARDARTRKPELLFSARLTRPAASVVRSADEHDDLIAIPDAPDQLRAFIETHRQRIVPIGLACLTARADHHYGADRRG